MGGDLAATTNDLVKAFNLLPKQAANLVGVAQKKGWLTTNGQPKTTTEKGGQVGSTIGAGGEVLSRRPSIVRPLRRRRRTWCG